MNSRIVAALVLAPLACGICLGVLMLSGLDPARQSSQVPLYLFFLPGLLDGALFEVVALAPVLYVLRRKRRLTRTVLFLSGVALWALAILLNVAATAEITVAEALPVLPRLMLPGIALVVCHLPAYRSQSVFGIKEPPDFRHIGASACSA